MGNLSSPSLGELLANAITFWVIGFILFIGRIASRVIQGNGFKHIRVDDYIMCVTFCFYTALMILIIISAHYATNLYPPEQEDAILANPKDIADRVYGSKIVIGLEFCMMASTWGVKACLLTTYYKMTFSLSMNLWVRIVMVYTAIGYFVVELTYFAVWCRPFHQYWALPVDNPQCATYQYYSITQAVFNISSDFMIISIPIPLLARLRLPLLKKVILMIVFSLGIFIILAAILNKYYNFSNPLTTVYQLWYIREASVAIFVVNLICWWPLLRKVFGVKAFDPEDNSGGGVRRESAQASPSPMISNRRPSKTRGPLSSWVEKMATSDSSKIETFNMTSNASLENILPGGPGMSAKNGGTPESLGTIQESNEKGQHHLAVNPENGSKSDGLEYFLSNSTDEKDISILRKKSDNSFS